jgi:MYXO-CTERM domain-containing protein
MLPRAWVGVLLLALLALPAAAQPPVLRVTPDIADPDLQPGEQGNVIVTLANGGNQTLTRLRLTAFLEPLTSQIQVSPRYLERVDGEQSAQVNLPLSVNPGAEKGTFSIRVVVNYSRGAQEESAEGYVRINITNPPLLDVVAVRAEPEPVPRQPFTLQVTVKNQGVGTARHVRLLFAYEVSQQQEVNPTQAFSPSALAQSNLQLVEIPFNPLRDFIGYAGTLRPGEEAVVEFPLISGEGAKAGPYSIPVTLLYQSDNGQEQSPVKTVVGFVLGGAPRLEVAGVRTDPARVSPNQEFLLTVQLENAGTGEARSVRAVLDGRATEFLGTVRPRDVASSLFTLRSGPAGLENHTLQVRYLDGQGTELVLREDLTVTVAGGGNGGPGAVAGALLLAAALGALWWIRRRRKTPD